MNLSAFKQNVRKVLGFGKGRRIKNICLTPDHDKHAAVFYLTSPFLSGFIHPLPNERNIMAIVGCLIEKGYVVDIYDYNWQGEIDDKYDVILGFGTAFEKHCKHNNSNKAVKKILYLTEMPPSYSIQTENERKRILEKKLGSGALETRSSKYYSENMLSLVDMIIAIGSDAQQQQISKVTNVPIFMLKPTIIPNLCSIDDVDETRDINQFCWIGSSGALLKGLDTLIEAFNELPDYKLKLFGVKGKDKAFLKLISGNNIKDYGFISARSETFKSEVMSCSAVICPSFSEGISTGVLTAMALGCYPIVTHESGVILDNNFGRYLNGHDASDFLDAIRDLTDSNNDLISRKELATLVARDYSISSYRNNLFEILEKIGV